MSVNKVILVGNLGSDPETRQTGSGQSVCNFRIATSERWTSKDGEKQERTEWHSIVAWGKQGELAQQYLRKGRQVYVEGRLQSREYEDKEGVKRKVWEVNADHITFLGGGRDDERQGDQGGQRTQARQEAQGGQQRGGWGNGGGQRDNGAPRGNPGGWGRPPDNARDAVAARSEFPGSDDPIPF